MPKRKATADEAKLQAVDEIAGMVDAFCREHLNEEYAELCRRLTEKLARKRPSPLVSGKPNTWACGIVRTIGWVNFLDDRTQTPHMKLTAIDKAFGVGESTGQGKSMLIRKRFKIKSMDPKWSLRSRIDQNPMAWMIEVNGFLVDARILKREIQEEALRKGLIPYIPERPQIAEDDEECPSAPAGPRVLFHSIQRVTRPTTLYHDDYIYEATLIVAKDDDSPKLVNVAAFATSQLKRLRQEDETWEVDFRALPKSVMQTATHYVGIVVTQPDGRVMTESKVAQTPTANDLSALVANAIKRPLIGKPHRPARILLRRNRKWAPLISVLNEIGIEVELADELPFVADAYNEIVSQAEKVRSAGKRKPSARQAAVEEIFPSIAKWVQGYGHIEIGDQESFGFTVRALDYGGIVFEDDTPSTLAEAMAALEARLAQWFEEEVVD